MIRDVGKRPPLPHFIFQVCGTYVPIFLFQAEILHDPEFAKKVKGLERVLRVRTRIGDSDCGPLGAGASGKGLRNFVAPCCRRAGEFCTYDSCRVVLDDSGQAHPVRCHDGPGVAHVDSLRLHDNSALSGSHGGLETAPPARCPSTSVAFQPALQDGVEGVFQSGRRFWVLSQRWRQE